MQKTILMLAVVSLTAEPLHSMSHQRSRGYYAPAPQAQSSIGQETFIIGGIVVVLSGLAYLLYKNHHKTSLATAHQDLAQANIDIAEISGNHSQQIINALDGHIGDVQGAYRYRANLVADLNKVQTIISSIGSHKQAWAGYQEFHHQDAQALLTHAQKLQTILTNLQSTLNQVIARIEAEIQAEKDRRDLETYYAQQYEAFTPLIGVQDEELISQINFNYRSSNYPLVAAVEAAEKAHRELRAKAMKLGQDSVPRHNVLAFSNQIEQLIKILVNNPAYQTQREAKRNSDAVEADRAEQRRIAQAQLEQQKRLARAEEDRARAERERAEAELRTAQAKEKAVQIEREKWNNQWWDEILNGKPKPAPTNINITVKNPHGHQQI